MLASTTLDIIRSALRSDPNTAPAERKRLLHLLQHGPPPPPPAEATPPEVRLVRRVEAARRLGCSVRMIDRLAAEGLLAKRRLPLRKRAAGILESDLVQLIQAREAA
jgi:hypothetical protein